jgi:hypothetical protein
MAETPKYSRVPTEQPDIPTNVFRIRSNEHIPRIVNEISKRLEEKDEVILRCIGRAVGTADRNR